MKRHADYKDSDLQPTPEEIETLQKYRKRSWLSETWRGLRKNKGAVAGLVILVILLLLVIFADVLYDYDTVVIMPNYAETLQHPSLKHPFGTDEFGRDVLARIIHGGRYSLLIAAAVTAISLPVGGIIGAYSGYIGGEIDAVVMRIMDIFLAIPNMLLALAIVAALGPSMFNLMIAIAISNVPTYARILRSSVLSIKGTEFIEASRAAGAGTGTIVFREVIPNCLAQVIVQASISAAYVIVLAATLSFIGLGVQPPSSEWGAMLSSGREYMRNNNYLVLFPGLAIVITVIALNLLGDGLRDAMDPRLKK